MPFLCLYKKKAGDKTKEQRPPQAKGHRQLTEAGGTGGTVPRSLRKEHSPARTLTWAYKTDFGLPAFKPAREHMSAFSARQCMVTATTGSESRSPQGVTNKMVGVRGREEAGPPPSAAVPARVSRKPARRQIGGFTQGTWVVKFRNTDFQRQPQSTWCWSPDDSHPHPGFLRRPSRSPRLVEWGKERLCARALSSAFPSGSSPPVAEAGPTTGLCVLTLHWCRVAEL